MIVNGRIVTIAEVLAAKRKNNERNLSWKRMEGFRVIPCWVWVFDNGPTFPFGGTWLYVRTSRCDYRIGKDYHSFGIKEQIMSQFLQDGLCYEEWKRTFLNTYSKPDAKLPGRPNATALGWAVVYRRKLERVFAEKSLAYEYAREVCP